MSPSIGLILNSHLATLHELQTVYSYEDMLNLAETAMVAAYNEWAAGESVREDSNANR